MGIEDRMLSKNTLAVIFAMVAAFLAVSCSGPVATRPPSGPLTDLQDVEDLRASFNQDDGSIRLVLLLSPTLRI